MRKARSYHGKAARACLYCGTIPHYIKVYPSHWWRRLGYTKYKCAECRYTWRVYLSRNNDPTAPVSGS